VPLDSVIEFKRNVYQQALNELSRYLHSNHERRRRLRFNAS
ncbi:MAG: RNA pyrophosphohydrolase, partial [Burkholderiales bacterium]|nr:RNA pyrophosphohydrolase [Burkholderiales bacterium]